MNFIIDRLREPSTFAGLSGIAIALGLSNDQWTAISALVAGIAGVVAVFVTEKKSA